MKLFRFCRWSLAALPVFFMLISCDKLLPTSGNGELVQVKIRAVSVKGYGEASATRSAGSEKRIIGEPVTLSFGDGSLAEITVEEEVSALRDGDTSLADTVKFRVIAVDSDNKVYSYGDYGFAEGAPVLTNNTNLHVLNGVSYNYIFISYNNSALPPAPEEGDDLSNVTIAVAAGSNDLLWQTISNPQPDSDGVPVLNFNDIKHQLARVTLVLDANTNRTITNVADNSITLNAASSGSFKLTNGTFVSSSGTTNFSGWGTFGQQKITSNTSTFLESAAAYTFSFAENAVTLSENSTEKQTTAGSVTSDDFTFKAESSYTVTLRILKKTSNKFAGSNIYWDDSDQDPSKHKLTFKPYNESNTTPNPETYYQGVYFRWGSLIGISPARLSDGTIFNSGTTNNEGKNDGTPIYLKVNGEWKKTNVAYATSEDESSGKTRWFGDSSVGDNVTGDNGAWSPIPSYYDVSITSPVGNDAHSLLANPDFEHYKGDICNYINPAYRMPTANELTALYKSDAKNYYTTFNSSAITDQTADGKKELTTTFGAFTGISDSPYHLPASGFRNGNYGSLGGVGYAGYHWSGSAHSSTYVAYYLYFHSNGTVNTNGDNGSYGFSVRCVLIE